jgi:acyl-CoA thioester hydrolase
MQFETATDAAVRRAHRTEIQVRFSDTDALGHLNNTAYALYAEQGRVDFLDRFRSEGVYLILAHISLDFLRQVRFRDSVYVLTRVAKLGRTSITLEQEIYGNDALAARVRSVVVLFDYDAQKPVPVPDEVRVQLGPFM